MLLIIIVTSLFDILNLFSAMPTSCVWLFKEMNQSYTLCNDILSSLPLCMFSHLQFIILAAFYSLYTSVSCSFFPTSLWSIQFIFLCGVGMIISSVIFWVREWNHNDERGHAYPKLLLFASSFLLFYTSAPFFSASLFLTKSISMSRDKTN